MANLKPLGKRAAVAPVSPVSNAPRLGMVEHGIQPMPPRILIYGTEKIGKSTIAASAPKPIFIPTEDRVRNLNVSKFPVAESYEEVVANINALIDEKHDYETVVLDSLDWCESYIWDYVCRQNGVPTIEKVGKGFGKGYKEALLPWYQLVQLLSRLWKEKNMAVILVAHSQVETFDLAEGDSFKRYSPQLNKHAYSVWLQWVDAVMFATTKLTVANKRDEFGKSVGVARESNTAGGARVLKTIASPICVAGNCYNFAPEFPMGTEDHPCAWEHIIDGISNFYEKNLPRADVTAMAALPNEATGHDPASEVEAGAAPALAPLCFPPMREPGDDENEPTPF